MGPVSKLRLAAILAIATIASIASCSAGGDAPKHPGDSGAGAGSSGTNTGSGGADLTTGVGGGGGACQQLDVVFDPQIPTVLLLVDRSGSMFDINPDGNDFWDALKGAVLEVVKAKQSEVRFGLLTFTGIAGQECPLTTETPIALDNYDAIKTSYDAASVKPAMKLETPTAMVLVATAVPKLLGDTDPGAKYILFVTDGEPDRCDDSFAPCPRDDVVGAVQDAYAKGIGTLVFGLGLEANAQHLQDVANAGAGAPVMSPGDTALNACFAGNWANAKGTYAAAGGTTKYYTPDPTDAMALETALNAAVTGAKSCTFDLEGKIEVDLSHASEGKVYIDGEPVPYDSADGWSMSSPTQLVLNGEACAKLKAAMEGISFDFPCEIIEPK